MPLIENKQLTHFYKRFPKLSALIIIFWAVSLLVYTLMAHSNEPRIPTVADYDEIESHCLNRLFEELVEEPSNILYVTPTGPSTTRYDSMDPSFWIECLDLLEREILSNISNQ